MRCRRPLIPTFVAAAAVAVLAAGCGGSSPPTSSARPAAATTDLAGEAVAFAACMRSHGLSSYPDPQVSQSAGHAQMTISPGGLDPNSPAFKSATRACGHLLPELGSASGAISPQEQAQDLRFASCMRTHGVPNFPDPDHHGAFTLPSGVDQQAPQFLRATKACANVEPSSLSILNQPPGSS
jgi:hypothetical protein